MFKGEQGLGGCTGYADELSGVRCYELFLVQARAPAFYAIQLLVNLVRPIKGNIHNHVFGQGIESYILQPRIGDYLP